MKRQDFRFFHRLRVRWVEVDMQKIVFNGHYLMYFDTAVTGYWRALALPYEESFAALGGELYVKKATVEYHASARNDDQLDVALKCEHIGRSSMRFAGAIFRGNQLLITGELVYVFADPVEQTSRPVPDALRALLQDYEAGLPVTQLRLGAWDTLQADARRVRTEVFVEEQGIARDDEWDEADATAVHAVLSNRLGQPLATGRLLQHGPGVAKVGRMAVRHMLRGAHFGAEILQALTQAAAARGDHEVVLHAQRSAEGFYRRLGFAVRGEPFDEVGIAHVEMVLPLTAQTSASRA
ncbi:YbgC/FadM family acyl-CoA thioesterase [Pseudorhodoferax sp.]|uniref:YbgC/FadM family acyl-CoA thioesterase n=1 Tax=Pseudorhodoferax sp. TaxID=1993553 RepID=UPI002DD69626|nr:YbgC/FadM family acyl-CoA thioesterase [Pseudorhodoferax sp.]